MLSTERQVIFCLREHYLIGNNSSNDGLLQDGATAIIEALRKMQAMKSKNTLQHKIQP